MLGDVVQKFETFLYNDVVMYYAAATGICAFIGLYYIGEFLFSDRDPEPDFLSD
jgi:hypothetical protein